eukprot:1137865-Amphidinium_carterae.1
MEQPKVGVGFAMPSNKHATHTYTSIPLPIRFRSGCLLGMQVSCSSSGVGRSFLTYGEHSTTIRTLASLHVKVACKR